MNLSLRCSYSATAALGSVRDMEGAGEIERLADRVRHRKRKNRGRRSRMSEVYGSDGHVRAWGCLILYPGGETDVGSRIPWHS